MGSSNPSRVQLDVAASRHSPYTASQRNAQRKPRLALSTRSSSSSSQASPQSSTTGTPLKPTVSMLEEFEVEGLLGTGVPRSNSTQTGELSRSTTYQGSGFFQPYSPAATPTTSLGSISSTSHRGVPLSRTSTATTILEFPNGPTDPSYGTFDNSHISFSELGGLDSIDESVDEGSWVDTAEELSHGARPTLDMAFRCPLSDEYDSDDNVGMDATIIGLPLTYRDSTDTISYASSESASVSDTSPSSSEGSPRKRIWEISPDQYVPRPKGIPAQSVPSVLEIGMQWEREHQAELRSKGGNAANAAIGHTRRVYGDAQYLN